MKRTREIYDVFMRAVKEGSIPFGYYGPETCRWATPDEMRRFGLEDCPMAAKVTGASADPLPNSHSSYLRAPRLRQVDSLGICTCTTFRRRSIIR